MSYVHVPKLIGKPVGVKVRGKWGDSVLRRIVIGVHLRVDSRNGAIWVTHERGIYCQSV